MLKLENASAKALAKPKLWVAEASIRPKLKIAASFVHYQKWHIFFAIFKNFSIIQVWLRKKFPNNQVLLNNKSRHQKMFP